MMRVLAVLFLMGLVSPCYATFIRVEAGPNRPTSGGEFRVKFADTQAGLASAGWSAYNVFCIEKDEFLTLPGEYQLAESLGSLTDVAWQGRVNTNLGDQLSDKSKDLYLGYIFNTLGSGSYSGLDFNTASNKALNVQNGLWQLEDEQTANANLTLLLNNEVGSASAQLRADVKVLNLIGINGSGYHQSLIFYQGGLNSTPVPEPATAGLLGLGMLVAGAYRARRKSKANA